MYRFKAGRQTYFSAPRVDNNCCYCSNAIREQHHIISHDNLGGSSPRPPTPPASCPLQIARTSHWQKLTVQITVTFKLLLTLRMVCKLRGKKKLLKKRHITFKRFHYEIPQAHERML